LEHERFYRIKRKPLGKKCFKFKVSILESRNWRKTGDSEH
jgi:hypothetical protein